MQFPSLMTLVPQAAEGHVPVVDPGSADGALALVWLVVALPLLGGAVLLLGGRRTDAWGHLLGTARMGEDPATSVVDPWGRSHDVPNLFVVDGSVMVTGGGINPTSTIAAFALRAAEHLADTASALPAKV